MTDIPLLTLDTIAKYLKEREVNFDLKEQNDQRFLRTGWRFEMGDATVLLSVNDSSNHTSRLEITCVTQTTYAAHQAEVLAFLNARNRELAFSRSVDGDGNVWLEYVGLYPTLTEWPQETFDTLFGGVLSHFQEDYGLLEQRFGVLQT
ncbi:YbjN domain-containing protein [Deinococcus detaillensis]|uniref:YbjN domain-containing protein n=1 Tax=Deinococcus detaillensis TaxID=2592048 RepID=A0A553V445_9DEIO|nr:YbjN domain-containing protein [Deinococcus detaillensis]TSA87270.1 YbjN domain-containing protein [Deinococcus detaillensis]